MIFVNPFGSDSNSYILEGEGGCIVVDPSGRAVTEELSRRNLTCKFVLLTHGHFDHVGACATLQQKGAKIYCGEGEKDFIFSKENLSVFGGVHIPRFSVDKTLADGEKFSLCGVEFTAISTPGHTAGGMSYISGGNLFCGDTLFAGSIGRTDLPTGDFKTLISSLKKIGLLNGNLKVCPGHGSCSVLKEEILYNPYFKLC